MSTDTQDLVELTADDRTVLAALDRRGDQMLAQTLDWARTNTGSWNADGLNAFAPELTHAFGALDAEVQAIETAPVSKIGEDGEATQFQSGPVIRIGARPEAEAQIVMSGHYDTVFPPGTFEEIKDLGEGRIGGPGVADMKGGLVVMLEALKAFEQSPLKDRLGYQIVITPDEETGNFASADYLREAASDGALIGLTYEPAMETGAMAGGRKGSAIYDLVLHGKASHAGRAPEAGVNAVTGAARCSAAIDALNGRRAGVTFNVGKIDGGGAVNIVPDLAVIRLGVRAPDAAGAEWADREIRAAFDVEANAPGLHGHVHGGFYRPPKPRNAAQSALFDAVAGTGRALGLNLEFVDTGGVCEGNNIFAAGVPNIDTLGVRGGRIHSAEEFVVKDSFVERASLSALILTRIADGRIDAARIKSLMEPANGA